MTNEVMNYFLRNINSIFSFLVFIKFFFENYAPKRFTFRCLLSLDFSAFAEGQRFVAVQHYEALPEEAEVEELVTPLNPVRVGIG